MPDRFKTAWTNRLRNRAKSRQADPACRNDRFGVGDIDYRMDRVGVMANPLAYLTVRVSCSSHRR